jgi:transcriptional regulator with XRE-family HTH domain
VHPDPDHKRATEAVARAVRRLRTDRTWTLDEVARRSGISRRLIVQIEQGQANPSIGTLLRLANVFEVTLSELVATEPATPVGVRRSGQELKLWSGPRGGAGRMLVSRGPLELWSWTLRPGERHESEQHRPGSIELLNVVRGSVRIDVGGETFSLDPGDSVWFEAAVAHAYENPTRANAEFMLAMLEL